MNPKAKNWIIGISCFFGGMLVTIIGFIILTIYVSFIRVPKSEPKPYIDLVDEETMRMQEPFSMPMLATDRCEELSAASIPVGSWWTDGDVYFQVLSNEADTLYMEGTDLENDGMELTFLLQDDNMMLTDGASVFAMHASPAIARQIQLADGSFIQVIVTYYDNDLLRPQAILQRYHGKGLE